ncbi:hypothetical protein QE152_g27231 [Popillia japonica]|uniref:Uncharacterized protein n=1 Tax=Popillia japonica TaxID=7064 RepID=A0AAW1JVZ7_POPJA
MLYATNIQSAAVKFACEREKMTLQKFATKYDISVAPAGLFVDTDYGYIHRCVPRWSRTGRCPSRSKVQL